MNYWKHPSAEVASDATVGTQTKIWHHAQVLPGATIGKQCVIGHNCLVAGSASLGNGVKLQSNIDVWDLVTLEDHVFVGPSVVFTNDPTPRAKYPKKDFPELGAWQPTLVKTGATIGARATILPGITIGEHALVGAGAVVTKNIPDYALVIGVPGRQVGWVCECGNTLKFRGAKGVCKYCARCYTKKGNSLSPAV